MKAEDLKNSILQLAMEGKLVPQDPNDEPASVLLDKIRAEKEKLIKEKKIRKNNKESIIFRKNGHFYETIGKKGEPVCIDDELPFDIPDSWEWCRFGYIVNYSLGKTPPRKEPIFWDDATIPWVSISDMIDGKMINSTKENVNTYALEKSFKGILVPKNTLLMSFKLTVGKVSILGIDAVHNEAIISIKPFIDENNSFRDYLFRILPLISQTGDTKSAIKGKTLNSKSLNKLLIPLPPLKEQKRIVNKIEEILPLIEEYGVNEEKLDKLNSEFPDKLKSSILQEAIQGKLVPQNPDDEPTSVLLEKIRDEKERLIKEKKIKRNKNESFIYKTNEHYYEKVGKNGNLICIDNEIPFKIPETWEWCRLNSIGLLQTGTTPSTKKAEYYGNEIPFIKPGDIYFDKIDYDNESLSNLGMTKSRLIKKNSVMMVCIGGSRGKCYYNDRDVCCNQQINTITPYMVYYKFLYYFMISDYFQKIVWENATGTATPIMNKSNWGNILICLPPLNEQKRIVEKIENIIIKLNV